MRLINLFTLLLLSCFQAVATSAGYVRIYNCLSNGLTITPFLGGKPLVQRPIESGNCRAGMYFATGKHRFRVDLSEGKVSPIVVKVPSKGQLTIVCFHLLDPQTQQLRPRLFSLSDRSQSVPKGYQPLRVKSLSRSPLELNLGFDQLFLGPLKSGHSDKWKGGDISLSYGTGITKKLTTHGKGAHTILIWDESEDSLQSIIVDHSTPSLPQGLRKDLTFGPRREELPYLIKMK